MQIINEFLQQDKKNAPMLAWETIHGKPFQGFRRGRLPNTKERNWNGLMVDEKLKDKWLNDLSKIKEITVRSSCQGHPPEGEWPSYIIFRLNDESKVAQVCKRLQDKKITFCKAEKGPQGFMRICVATPLYADGPRHKEWEQWWESLSKRIIKSIK